MSINPQDPVIQMLKGIITQFQEKIDELTDSMEAMMQGTGAAINNLNSRILELDAKVAMLELKQEGPVPPSEEGKEL